MLRAVVAVEATPFSTIRSASLRIAFNLVCDNGLEYDYIRFFRLTAPALIADWAGFSEKFAQYSWDIMLPILYHICVRIYHASGTNAVFLENPNEIAEDLLRNEWMDDYSTEFVEDCIRCALYIELAHPINRRRGKNNRKLRESIHRIAAICNKYNDVSPHDCIMHYLSTNELTEDGERNRELIRFKNIGASDVISAFEPQTQQDEALILRLVLKLFFEMTSGEMIIYNPPPIVLREFHNIGGTPNKTAFVIPDVLEAQAYQREFPEYKIYGGDMQSKNTHNNILVLDSNGSLSYGHVVEILNKCKVGAPQFLIYAPQTKIVNINDALEKSGLFIDAVLGLPTGVSQEIPAKKALLFGSNEPHEVFRIMEGERNVQFGRGKTSKPFLPVNALYISRKFVEAPREWLHLDMTIKQMVINKTAPVNEGKKYRGACEVAWSPEITICYQIYPRENGNLEGRAYVRTVAYKRGKIQYGKKVGELKSRGLRGKFADMILERLPDILFEEERYYEYVPILERLHNDCPDGLSLKSIWYILWKDLQINKSSYSDAVCRELFCGECQALANIKPVTASVESILEALEMVCGYRDVPAAYLKQLSLIFSAAVERKLLSDNKLKNVLARVRTQKKEMENLVSRSRKRTITDAQTTCILKYLMEVDTGYPRYASNCESFFMAISLFAPIYLAQLRALTWGDIVFCSDICVIAVSKKIIRDGRMITINPPYRVPCSPIIQMLCLDRLAYLEAQCGITVEMLKNKPFFWEYDPNSASDLKHISEPISHATAKKLQRKMLMIAKITVDNTHVTDGDKTITIDLNNPLLRTFWCDNVVTQAALMGLEGGEVSYLLGRKPADTVDANYFGFEAPYNLMRMAAIQHRWTAPYEALLRPASDTVWKRHWQVDWEAKIESSCDLGMRSFLFFEIEGGEEIQLKIESGFGHEVTITQL